MAEFTAGVVVGVLFSWIIEHPVQAKTLAVSAFNAVRALVSRK